MQKECGEPGKQWRFAGLSCRCPDGPNADAAAGRRCCWVAVAAGCDLSLCRTQRHRGIIWEAIEMEAVKMEARGCGTCACPMAASTVR